MSTVAAVVLLAGGFGLHAAGWTRLASPGPLVSGHGNIEVTCAQCHAPHRGTADLRCERCHDPVDAHRFSPAAHVLTSTNDAWKAAHTGAIACAGCHTEHKGTAAPLTRVADGGCTSCHQIGSFAVHPEFANVRAGSRNPVGIHFSHAKHLAVLKARNISGQCEGCHQLAPDERHYIPLNFDRHCASCHVKDGALTDGVTALHATWPNGEAPQGGDALGHRDPRILGELARLRGVLDPGATGDAAKRAALRAELARLESEWPLRTAGLDQASRQRWRSAIAADVADLDRRQGQERSAASAKPSESLDARRQELTDLIAAIRARGDASAAAKADDLERRLKALPNVPDESGVAATYLLDQVDALDGTIAAVASWLDPSDANALRTAAWGVRQRLQTSSNATPVDVEARRAELLALADRLEPYADAVQKQRLAELRRETAALALGTTGDSALARRRTALSRLLDRLQVEEELAGTARPTEALIGQQTSAWVERVRAVREQLASLSTTAAAPQGITKRAASLQAENLFGACAFCHRLTAERTGIVPVSTRLTVLDPAAFSHKSHIGTGTCDSCHGDLTKVGDRAPEPQDSLVPPVASCRTCHTPGKSRADCVSCHSYHGGQPTMMAAR